MKREDITDEELTLIRDLRRKKAFLYAYQRGTGDAKEIVVCKGLEIISELRKVGCPSSIIADVENSLGNIAKLIHSLRAEG